MYLYDVITIGTPMVEIMRTKTDVPLNVTGEFTGPFPAGDTSIMIVAAARLGAKTAFLGMAGTDHFSDCLKNKFTESGVDISGMKTTAGKNTGIAFISYFSDGSREYVFTVPSSSAACFGPEHLDTQIVKSTKCIHISGFAMSISPTLVKAVDKALEVISDDTVVAFDPNYRRELLDINKFKHICSAAFERCNLFLPSVGEACIFGNSTDDLLCCRQIAAQGKTVARKEGRNGSTIFAGDEMIHVKPIDVEEVDPTGAGDVFSAAFLVSAYLERKPYTQAAIFANTAAGLSVMKKGPMEGIPSRFDVDACFTGGC